MRPSYLAILTAVVVTMGCQEAQVRNKADLLTGSVPDLYYQEVLNDLALAVAKPAVMPYFGVPQQATATDARQITASYTPTLDLIESAGAFFGRWSVDKNQFGLMGQQQSQEAFQMAPLTDPDKMGLIHEAFLIAAGRKEFDACSPLCKYYEAKAKAAAPPSPTLVSPAPPSTPPAPPSTPPAPPSGTTTASTSPKIIYFHYETSIKPGWFNVGQKRDVPKHACFVSHCCDVWIWVPEDHLTDLTDFTYAILDIATIDANRLVKSGGTPEERRSTATNLGAATARQRIAVAQFNAALLVRDNAKARLDAFHKLHWKGLPPQGVIADLVVYTRQSTDPLPPLPEQLSQAQTGTQLPTTIKVPEATAGSNNAPSDAAPNGTTQSKLNALLREWYELLAALNNAQKALDDAEKELRAAETALAVAKADYEILMTPQLLLTPRMPQFPYPAPPTTAILQ